MNTNTSVVWLISITTHSTTVRGSDREHTEAHLAASTQPILFSILLLSFFCFFFFLFFILFFPFSSFPHNMYFHNMDICTPDDISPPATPPNFNFTNSSSSQGSSSTPLPTSSSNNRPSQRLKTSQNSSSSLSNEFSFSEDQLNHLRHLKQSFQQLPPQQKQFLLYEIINSCDNSQLTYLNNIIAPRLKIDFLKELPIEISLHILTFIDDPKTLARAATVSTLWNSLLKDEATWKSLCMKHQYRRRNSSICGGELLEPPSQRRNFSYREYFKRKYNIAAAWAHGGKVKVVEDGFGEGLVTSLQYDEKYIVVGCDNHRIEVFDTNTAEKVRTLEGHEGGVWALQFKGGEKHDPERVLVTGGCDR